VIGKVISDFPHNSIGALQGPWQVPAFMAQVPPVQ